MTIALIIVYLWAGASMLFALWQLESIKEALNDLLPEEHHIKTDLCKNHILCVAFGASNMAIYLAHGVPMTLSKICEKELIDIQQRLKNLANTDSRITIEGSST